MVLSFKSHLKSAQVALEGFPWKLATILYTLSWGWSLLRPNTLYWDDWAYIYNKPKSYLNQIFVDTGLPPWRALIDQELIEVGYWTIPFLTFIMFYGSGICLHLILKTSTLISDEQKRYITLLFLLLPINHSRIALVLFGYSTSYFLFFFAWLLIIRTRRLLPFLIAIILFFWSFMTHSFLFFFALPALHFVLNNYSKLRINLQNLELFARALCLFSLPFIYYILRSFFWYPKPEWDGYHSISLDGAKSGLMFLAAGFIMIRLSIFLYYLFKSAKRSAFLVWGGWLIFAWGLFPYIASGRFRNFVSVFAFRSDWGGRNIMLTPLGVALMLGGLFGILPSLLKKTITFGSLALCLAINCFFGSQFYLDSLKKEQLTNLFAEASLSQKVNRDSELFFVDNTKIFNGRFSTYRDTELRSLLTLASVNAKSITGNTPCQNNPNAIEIRLNTNRSYLESIISGDLGLYLDVKSC